MSAQQQILAGIRGLTVPVNTVAPVAYNGSNVGQTLFCDTGSWTQSPSSYAYQWRRDGADIGPNQNSYLLTLADLGATMTCRVTATNAAGSTSAISNAIGPIGNNGEQTYVGGGTYSWTAPAGVTSVSVVCVGTWWNNGAGYGNGGALAYKNNIAVTPGNSYTVVIGADNTPTRSSFIDNATVSAGSASNRTGDGGGDGGAYQGGAGGYAGNGGYGGATGSPGTGFDGAGGGGGGGGRSEKPSAPSFSPFAGSGGVGLLGQGSNGVGGYGEYSESASFAGGGGGGSGGGAGGATFLPSTLGGGGSYGGAPGMTSGYVFNANAGGQGAVRIIWPGTTRSFPSTNTGNL